jgi:hypothetical protein
LTAPPVWFSPEAIDQEYRKSGFPSARYQCHDAVPAIARCDGARGFSRAVLH